MQRVINAVLTLLNFDFRSAANLDHSYAASKLCKTLLQLLFVVIACGGFDLRTDLFDARLDVSFAAGTVNNRGVVLVDSDALGFTQHAERDVLELDAEVFADHFALGEDRNVLQHRLAAITEARCLDRSHFQATAQLVDNECRQRFALDVFCDNQQRTARLDSRFEDRKHRLQVRKLLLVDQDVWVVEFNRHFVRVSDEVRAEVAAVELHAFNNIEFKLEALGFFNGDNAFFADLFHRFSDFLANFTVAIGRDNADLSDFR